MLRHFIVTSPVISQVSIKYLHELQVHMCTFIHLSHCQVFPCMVTCNIVIKIPT